MPKLVALALAALFAANFALAQTPAPAKPAAANDCKARALSKSGKPLAGAAKTAFMKKCGTTAAPAAPAAPGAAMPAAAGKNACAEKAVSKSGKPLAGAAKAAFMKKCAADAKAAR